MFGGPSLSRQSLIYKYSVHDVFMLFEENKWSELWSIFVKEESYGEPRKYKVQWISMGYRLIR